MIVPNFIKYNSIFDKCIFFHKEWTKFDQSRVSSDELLKIFNQYFALFPWEQLPKNPKGFDLGCGSGRWAVFCSPKVGELNCIDSSDAALQIAKKTFPVSIIVFTIERVLIIFL